MKTLKKSATVKAVLGFFFVFALVFLFLALSDIAHMEEDLTLEWYVAGTCMIILAAFTLSTFVTLGLKHFKISRTCGLMAAPGNTTSLYCRRYKQAVT
jgi:hypothetical protein